MTNEYNPAVIEEKWQRYWEKHQTFKLRPGEGKRLYILDMFPYTSGKGMHAGHPLGYTGSDIFARFKRMCGYQVLHPMGFDAFGLPAEQHAIQTGEHPGQATRRNCDRFRGQLKSLGLSYDWDREIATCDVNYYHWTQWIFLQVYNAWFDDQEQRARPISELSVPPEVAAQGALAVQDYQAQYRLAYYADSMVNWCPALGTVLANEEVIDGRSERGGHAVFRKPMKQWMLRITKYAERLLSELEEPDWPESIKELQRHWIGRRTGAEIVFPIVDCDQRLTAFTTRPDTLFGVTFFVVSPEHPLIAQLVTAEHSAAVQEYCEAALRLSDFDRTLENREKTGVFTGSFVSNPINEEQVPVYVGDYVLMGYGTGAVMGVPAHDERDFDFAKKFGIPIRPVIVPTGPHGELRAEILRRERAYTEPGEMLPIPDVVAGKLNLVGCPSEEAKQWIVDWLAEHGFGRRVVSYRLRDWVFSRQRYWGEPIPIVHWESGRMSALSEDELPLVLPEVDDYLPSEGGESPLAKAAEWLYVTDPVTGERGRRETNTMPQWAGSCWYYLRFIDPHNQRAFCDPQMERQWMPVDLYVGGAEHAVLHLLYSRFWHKVLFDLGHVSTKEPFARLFNQGMLTSFAYRDCRGALVPIDEVDEEAEGVFRRRSDGELVERISAKMSKSLRNVVVPDEIIREYGADTLRTYLMFMGPLEASKVWDPKAIQGNYRFLKRAWSLVSDVQNGGQSPAISEDEELPEVRRALHRTIKKVSEDIENIRYNTAISALMEFLNLASKKRVSRRTLESFVLLLSPFAPHIGEELWARLGHKESLANAAWPTYDQTLLQVDTVTVVIQVNGRKRSTFECAVDADDKAVRAAVQSALESTSYQLSQEDRTIIVRHGAGGGPRLVNVIQKR